MKAKKRKEEEGKWKGKRYKEVIGEIRTRGKGRGERTNKGIGE